MTTGNGSDFEGLVSELTELRNQVAQLERQNTAIVGFLSTAAHDLRTPLNATLGFARLLRDQDSGELNSIQARFVDNILTSSTHLLLLINDLVDLSILESGNTVLDLVEVDLNDCLTHSRDRVTMAAQEKGVRIVLQDAQRDVSMQVNERRLRQLVFNLVANAVKSAPEGGLVTLNAASQGGSISISVTDNGDAIPADKLSKVFEPFGLGPPQVDALVASTGLGLSIASLIAKLHGGDIAVESNQEAGSTFTVTIPQ